MATKDSSDQDISRLLRVMPFSPLTPEYEKRLQGLKDVDVELEGRTLLQEAVVHGKRDWVMALLNAGADPGISSTRFDMTALELARQKTDQHRGNAELKDILAGLLEKDTKRSTRKDGGRSVDAAGERPTWEDNRRADPPLGADLHREEPQSMMSPRATGSEDGAKINAGTVLTSLSKEVIGARSKLQSNSTTLVATSEKSDVIATFLSRKMVSREKMSDEVKEMSKEMTGSTSAGEVNDSKEHSTVGAMDLSSLENMLGVELAACGRRVILPRDRWQFLKKEGTSLLIKAARDGATECVDLLLRCGCDANASLANQDFESKRQGLLSDQTKRAIDFAVDGDHDGVVLLLLQWDSILPNVSHPQGQFGSMIERNVKIRDFLRERDEFHASIKNGYLVQTEEILSRNECYLGEANLWVDRKGISSLYLAAYENKYEVWALLKSKKFECLPSEIEKIKIILEDENNQAKFNRAMYKYFTEVEDCHVYKMLMKSMSLGSHHEARYPLPNIYQQANNVPEAKLLLQCLQDEPHFEVIFDLEKRDITRMYMGSTSTTWGILDPLLNRVYVSASLDSLSEVVSNLMHELAHKVMYVVFGNRGLPYREEDKEKRIAYEEIASIVLSADILEGCNDIIKRVNDYQEEERFQELIVRIPEIISKFQVDNGSNDRDNLWKNQHEQDLFNFYSSRVEPEIKKWIETKDASKSMPICDALNYPELLSGYVSDDVHVDDEIEEPKTFFYHGVGFLQVSNLKLGLRHLQKSLKNLVVVDWTRFRNAKMYFKSLLRRRYVDNLAVVWDEKEMQSLCNDPSQCQWNCPANIFLDCEKYVTLVVPKKFVVPHGNEPMEYGWGHLSAKTKTWVLDRRVKFQGNEVTLKSMIESVIKREEVDSTMSTLLDADDISSLIDGKTFEFGSHIEAEMAERKKLILRDHPTVFIPRKMRVRPVILKETLNKERIRDAVFIGNATEDDVKKSITTKYQKWDGEGKSDGCRLFLVDEDVYAGGEDDGCKRVCEQLKQSATERNWHFAHFFRYVEKEFCHVHSQCIKPGRCLLLADDPGSGKSVIAFTKAQKEKNTHSDRWVEVVELTEHEGAISLWKENNSKFNHEEFLFHMVSIKGSTKTSSLGESTLEKRMFKLFCHSKGKVSLYVDGFDEICPDYKEDCSSILETFLHGTRVNFFLTTRTHECSDLEKRLSTVAYNLIPFSKMEQVLFMNTTWNALLRSLGKSERIEKIRSIVPNIQARSKSETNTNLVQKLEQLLIMDTIPKNREINFTGLAEELIDIGKPTAKTEGYVSEHPLNTSMMASVFFRDNFIPSASLRFSYLYERFVELKIEIYSLEKAKIGKRVVVGSMSTHFDQSIRKLLKEFAASVFLKQDSGYKLSGSDITDLLRVGLVIKKDNSLAFIHRTFAEYLFAIWILEKATEKEEATTVFLTKVLLEEQFEKVRKFIDELLLSQNGNSLNQNEEETDGKKILPKISDSLYKTTIQKSFKKSMDECHMGILQYLAEISGENLGNVLFGVVGGRKALQYEGSPLPHSSSCNAFTHCGECIRDSRSSTERRLESLKTLNTLLTLTEKNDNLEYLRNFISKEGFWWTGLHEFSLWGKKEMRTQLHMIIDFFLRHGNDLREALKDNIMGKGGEELFANVSRYSSFNLMQRLLESILEPGDFEKLLISSSDDARFHSNTHLVTAWINVINHGTIDEVKEIWKYLESKLNTREKRGEFLRRKDYGGRNSFISALKTNNHDVNTFVLKLLKIEITKAELNEMIYESFKGCNIAYTLLQRGLSPFVEWLNESSKMKSMSFEKAMDELRSEGKEGLSFIDEFISELPSTP